MWVTYMPQYPKCLELGILFKSEYKLSLIKIWNYNKSLIDSVKGVKEIELLLDGNIVWAGTIRRGPGNEYEDYVTNI